MKEVSISHSTPFLTQRSLRELSSAIDSVLKRWLAQIEKVHDTVEVDIVRRQETALEESAA